MKGKVLLLYPTLPLSLFKIKNIFPLTVLIILPDPGLAILNLGVDRFPIQYHNVILQILLAAKSLITKMWHKTLAPNISELIAIVNLYYTYEGTLAIRANILTKFEQAWQYWIMVLFTKL